MDIPAFGLGNSYMPSNQNQGNYTRLPGMGMPDAFSMMGQVSPNDPRAGVGPSFGAPPSFKSQLPSSGPGMLQSNGSQSGFDLSPYLTQMNAPGRFQQDQSFMGQIGQMFGQSDGSWIPGAPVQAFNTSPFQQYANPNFNTAGTPWSQIQNQFQQGMNGFNAWQSQYPNQGGLYNGQNAYDYAHGFGGTGNPTIPWNLDPGNVAPVLQNSYQDAYNNYAKTGTFGVPGSDTSTNPNMRTR